MAKLLAATCDELAQVVDRPNETSGVTPSRRELRYRADALSLVGRGAVWGVKVYTTAENTCRILPQTVLCLFDLGQDSGGDHDLAGRDCFARQADRCSGR